jgi:hypothetical protein
MEIVKLWLASVRHQLSDWLVGRGHDRQYILTAVGGWKRRGQSWWISGVYDARESAARSSLARSLAQADGVMVWI